MRISRIAIQNYRNFKSFEIDLKEFSLIIGENNIGKTNFLNALGLIFSQDITFFKKRSLEIDDINYHAIENFKQDIINPDVEIQKIRFVEVKIEVFLTDFLGNSKQEAVVADWLIDDTLSIAKLTYHYSLREDLTNWVKDIRKNGITNIDFPLNKYDYLIYGGLDSTKQVDFYLLKMLKFDFLDALRDAKSQLIASGDYRLLYKVLNNLGEGKFENIKEVLKELKRKVDENDAITELRDNISSFLDKTSLVEDDKYNQVRFEFTRIEESEILKKLSLIYGDAPLTIDRNGLGRNNLLYISLILSHLLNIKDNSTCFRIIAIEEPEAHLHPQLQEHLAKSIQSLTNDQIQIIITSHSTHITSKLSLENTIVLFSDIINNKVSNHSILNNFANETGVLNAESKQSIRYLERFLDSTKSTMFFARKIILVEGIAEQTLLPIFFERTYGKTLEKEGIAIVNVNSVAFEHFLKILKNGYFIKGLVLTDSDKNTKQNNRAEKLKLKFQEYSEVVNVQSTATQTFETEIINENKAEDECRRTLLKAISMTRPQSGGEEFAIYFNRTRSITDFFELIERRNSKSEKVCDYKSEFSTDLAQVLFERKEGDNSKFVYEFKVPQYILDGFKFLIENIYDQH